MTDTTQPTQHPADRLRARLADGRILAVPAVFDALSARLAERAGAEAVFMGGFGVSASRLGMLDLGLISYGEMLDQARAILGAISLPLFVDGDTGYGGESNIARTVDGYRAAGAACIMIEDQVWPKRCGHLAGKQVVDRAEAVARVRAAVAARDAARRTFGAAPAILARTDARGPVGLDEAVWRTQAFADAGADLVFLEAPADRGELERAATCAPVPTMANMLPGGTTPWMSPAELEAMGFAMVAYATDLIGAAAAGMERALADLMQGEPAQDALPLAALKDRLIGG